ncbi:PREDICTED: uncharacterized protein LOC108759544 [Trachymyrmex cornetzi]|uniref:uncharacterized protein LOC108759544 n=1 Tax=Trachymyrmex cornetzi TaxID=471704 RepID=UPI00084F360F|nr:PREDICTED: uncharacterized protein LOC108759544 [Trachymyrmex cornetzi]
MDRKHSRDMDERASRSKKRKFTGFSNTLYYAVVENIYIGAKAIFDILRRKAVEEEKIKNSKNGKSITEITVSGDATWKKRGFSLLFGITTLIGKYTNKVIDLLVKSACCHACKLWESKHETPEYEIWKENHTEECTVNHDGSAGKTEIDTVKEMFNRSWVLLEIKYAYYIGDGDSKTFKALLDNNLYGNNLQVKKKCVRHVEKRMGSRLRNIKKTHKLGGKNKLTNTRVTICILSLIIKKQ